MNNVFGKAVTVQERLVVIHASLREEFPAITRIAIAVYDIRTDTLKAFAHSSDGAPPLAYAVESLSRLPAAADPVNRHIDQAVTSLAGERERLARIAASYQETLIETGYRSSYTVPFYDQGDPLGFIFFDSRHDDYFNSIVTSRLSLYSHLITLFIIDAIRQSNALRSAVAIARDFGFRRDRYTGAHIDRMAHFSRVIAHAMAETCQFAEDFVECVFLFAPLHDIGKIAIPDEILLKRGRLTPAEYAMMQHHVSEGVAIVDKIIDSFRVGSGQHAQTMRNIVRYHHERFDGSGYLAGLAGDDIPIEARIISVADVFDALTNERPYKPALSNEHAFAYLSEGGGHQFDRRCVDALIANRSEIEAIQERFNAAAANSVAGPAAT